MVACWLAEGNECPQGEAGVAMKCSTDLDDKQYTAAVVFYFEARMHSIFVGRKVLGSQSASRRVAGSDLVYRSYVPW